LDGMGQSDVVGLDEPKELLEDPDEPERKGQSEEVGLDEPEEDLDTSQRGRASQRWKALMSHRGNKEELEESSCLVVATPWGGRRRLAADCFSMKIAYNYGLWGCLQPSTSCSRLVTPKHFYISFHGN
jgi:hypothetical protein